MTTILGHGLWLISLITALLTCGAATVLFSFNGSISASASPTPGATARPPAHPRSAPSYPLLQITVTAAIGVATVTGTFLALRLARKNEKREAQRDQDASVAFDPAAVVHIIKEAEAHCTFINDNLMQIFGDLSNISDLRHQYIDDRHPLLLREDLFPTEAQNRQYDELLAELGRHSQALERKVNKLQSMLRLLARVESSPLSPTRLAHGLDPVEYLAARLQKPEKLFPEEAKRLLASATEEFDKGRSRQEHGNGSS